MEKFSNEPGKFPLGKKRKEIVSGAALRTKFAKLSGPIFHGGSYDWVDSALDEQESSWAYSNVPMAESFKGILPEGVSLRDYIEGLLKEKKGKAIGVEFGGPGIRAFKSFSPGFFDRSFGVSLFNRPVLEMFTNRKRSNHEVLKGDIMQARTYQVLEKRLQGAKVDFIIERMAAGLDMLPEDPFVLTQILKRWYELLSEGGVMIVQVPVVANNMVKAWKEMIDVEHPNILVNFYEGRLNNGTHSSVFVLRKLPGAAKEMPTLNLSDASKIDRTYL